MNPIKLPSEFTVFNAEKCWHMLKAEYLQSPATGAQCLDLSVVEELDGCGAQTLWFVRELLAEKSIEFNVTGANDEVQETLKILGMRALIKGN